MRVKPFGKTGVDLCVIGQGTWNMPESGAGLREAQRALRRGVELGMTHIDTAEMYGTGTRRGADRRRDRRHRARAALYYD